MLGMVDEALLQQTRERVLAWFAEAGRDLPWRATRDPYRVLVAEVLAQQTQAARGAPRRPVAARPRRGGPAWGWSSALMDVGALHCRPRPRCGGCPLELTCRWRALGPAAPPPRPRAQAPFATSDRRWRGAGVRGPGAPPPGLGRA